MLILKVLFWKSQKLPQYPRNYYQVLFGIDYREILNENKRESEGSAAASILVAERERKEKEREAASRSLKRNTAILEDLSNFLKNSSSTWSDSENESSSPIGTL